MKSAPKRFRLFACAVVPILASLSSPGYAARECTLDKYACQVEILSWARVFLQGSAENTLNRGELEQYLRLRVRNDISFLEHETRAFFDVPLDPDPDKTYTPLDRELANIYDNEGREKYRKRKAEEEKKRSDLRCFVWTVGEGYPIAVHVNCTLSSWHKKFGDSEYETAFLGYTNQQKLNKTIKNMLSRAVESIAINLYNEREEFTDLEHGTQ